MDAAISVMDLNRSSRSLASALRMIASTSPGICTWSLVWFGGTGASKMCLVRIPMKVSALNGTAPVTISYMITPTA